ncbi:FecR family protein [Olivibacter domesticus]|uniref:FecR family protein n=1 Tax=Olivibacter domesticus TaxID=407022 RepID=A0A1H7ICI9_OLID1|nr:FecR family protein [Olivibacter domesticus]SEK59572.1 FecR family protein [Olivibacter domesticus]
MEPNFVKELIRRYVAGRCTARERAIVESYYLHLHAMGGQSGEIDYTAVGKQLWNTINKEKRSSYPMRIAAIMLLLLFTGSFAYYYLVQMPLVREDTGGRMQDIAPAEGRATLTFASGEDIDLATMVIGGTVTAEGVQITKEENGKIRYTVKDTRNRPNTHIYHTLTTPKGGQYQVVLQDSSHVFVNAGSTLRFSARFSDKERRVVLSGEAYFDVKAQPEKPFMVEVGGQQLQVLGTAFNVFGYLGEKQVTTLVNGKLQLKEYGQHWTLLHPGDQAVLSKHQYVVKKADLNEVTAWKEGIFMFNQVELKTILRELERWYDVKMEYQHLPKLEFYGELSRELKLSKILHWLELASGNKVHFTINKERRSVVVTNKQ